MSNNISITLNSESQYAIGDMININVNIANHRNKSINLYKPATSNGFLRYNLFSLNKDYEEKPYHGLFFYHRGKKIF